MLPSIPDTFHWTNESWGPALRCRPLEAIAPHLFTTRQLGLQTFPEGADDRHVDGWTALAAAMQVAHSAVARITQVHGNTVVVVKENGATPERPRADALVSQHPGVALAVVAADCVPLLMADARTGAVGAVHAGWRGTAAGVVAAAVDAMRREFGTRPEDLVVAVGPAIGSCCYEVGTELVDAFAAAGHERHLIDRWFLAPPPRRGDPPAARPKLRLDLPGANRDQLILAGVPYGSIHLAALCTATNLDVTTSYRVEREKVGRIAGVIRSPGL
jgi:polyphenol oxidase